jgi:ATP-dependent Lon protease, bacterial type
VHDVGVIATVREITPLDDGRFDLVTVGSTRVRVEELLTERSYLQAKVSPLPEQTGDDAALLAPRVRAAFATYRGLITDSEESTDDLPEDPGVLSYLVAAALILDVPDRQRLLEVPDDSARLLAELQRLRHETALLRTLPSLPALDLHTTPQSLN